MTMKKVLSILIIMVTTLLITFSCKKESRNSHINELVGTYKGVMNYTNYLSIDTSLGLPDQTGTDSFLLVITETTYAGHELALTYTDTADASNSVTYYADGIFENGAKIYFTIPLQYNEEGAEMRGNNCYISDLGTFDGVYTMSNGVLTFCTHYAISTPGSTSVFGETNEVYHKQ